MLTLSSWQTPATDYPTAPVGCAQIAVHRYRRGYYAAYGVRGHHHYQVTRPITIRALTINGKTWMVDDLPHWWAMEDHAKVFHGHVLVAGLGLGLIVHALAANPAVERVTVVESVRDVIDLVGPLLPAVTIEHGDFWDWRGKADGVLFDLFVGDGKELFPAAIRAYLELRDRFPLVRVHGYPNDKLHELWETINEQRRLGADQGRVLRDRSRGTGCLVGQRVPAGDDQGGLARIEGPADQPGGQWSQQWGCEQLRLPR